MPSPWLKFLNPAAWYHIFLLRGQTIDVSKSGMRVAIDKPLLHDALVQFSFDDSFPLKIHEVTGQVEWCNKQVDEPGYQAGLSFQDKCIIVMHEALSCLAAQSIRAYTRSMHGMGPRLT